MATAAAVIVLSLAAAAAAQDFPAVTDRDFSIDLYSGAALFTLGVDARVWQFCFWSERYRLRLSLTGDVAERYGNGGLSVGLWH